ALSLELSKKNADLIIERESLTMLAFLQMLLQVFKNHIRFRCMMLSVVHLMKQNKHMAAAYIKTQNVRNTTLKSNLLTLERAGYLEITDETDREFLVSSIALISRFWISEAAISFRAWSTKQQVRHYLTLITKLLLPYSTENSKKDISVFIDSLQ
ncbi:MAG TPA: TetR/AcrR family transcriptional regulator, partial [Flavisolibacter sp.]|nr:TetR/AcrR family transcriptional regulator [Flavisolibacter sp.]